MRGLTAAARIVRVVERRGIEPRLAGCKGRRRTSPRPGSTADDFIREFRNTVAYARLEVSGKVEPAPDDDEDNDPLDDRRDDPKAKKREQRPGLTVLSFQISDRLVEVAVPGGPLTKDEIAILRDYLNIQARIAPAGRDAIWRTAEADIPVKVTGALGLGPGRSGVEMVDL